MPYFQDQQVFFVHFYPRLTFPPRDVCLAALLSKTELFSMAGATHPVLLLLTLGLVHETLQLSKTEVDATTLSKPCSIILKTCPKKFDILSPKSKA